MKKYVQVGTGHRGIYCYSIPIVKEFSDCAKLCGVYDTNYKRANLVTKMTGVRVPVYDSFDKMLEDVRPDAVIVTTPDCDHDFYVVKALEFGCDVICEKPVTIDEHRLREIVQAEKRSGKRVIVTFNVRFMPFMVRIKELLMNNVVGDVLGIHFEWMLDTDHGADYFRRWHRERKNSGSLLVHKSTHHFDIINWLIEQEPISVNAFGTSRFYGNTRKERAERCLTCKFKNKCEFYIDLNKEQDQREIYLDCEDVDGYYRDRCVFADEIDIEDSVSVNVKYNKGSIMSYSLTAHSPYEGFRLAINGSGGRLECEMLGGIGAFSERNENRVRLYNRRGEEITYRIPAGALSMDTEHGGADPSMRHMIFGDASCDPLHQLAGLRAGAMSIGIGIAANKSMKENRAVELSEFLDFLD